MGRPWIAHLLGAIVLFAAFGGSAGATDLSASVDPGYRAAAGLGEQSCSEASRARLGLGPCPSDNAAVKTADSGGTRYRTWLKLARRCEPGLPDAGLALSDIEGRALECESRVRDGNF